VTNTPAYCDTEAIPGVKSLIVQGQVKFLFIYLFSNRVRRFSGNGQVVCFLRSLLFTGLEKDNSHWDYCFSDGSILNVKWTSLMQEIVVRWYICDWILVQLYDRTARIRDTNAGKQRPYF